MLLGNGMTAGALVAIIMIVFLEATRPRRRRLQIRLNNEALPELDKFLRAFAVRAGWNQASQDRLASAGEETLAVLMQTSREDIPLSLTVTASVDGGAADVEFVASLEGENVEDYMAHLSSLPPGPQRVRSILQAPALLCFFSPSPEVPRR